MRIFPVLLILIIYGTIFSQQIKELFPTQSPTQKSKVVNLEKFDSPESQREYQKIYYAWAKESNDSVYLKRLKEPTTENSSNPKKTTNAFRSNTFNWLYLAGLDTVIASSELESTTKKIQSAQFARDFSYTTAWIEGAEGNGIGEYIEYKFLPETPRMTRINLVNGMVKNPTLWKNSPRAKKIKMYVNGKPKSILNLEDSPSVQSFQIDTLGYSNAFSYERRKQMRPWTIRLEILEVYPGEVTEDLAITEIYFDAVEVHALPENTEITMADNSVKYISEIVLGDKILSKNFSTGKFEPVVVQELNTTMREKMYTIELENGNTLTCTATQILVGPKYSTFAIDSKQAKSEYQVEAVETLKVGTILTTVTGKSKVVAINPINELCMTYSIVKVSKTSNFIANGLVVSTDLIYPKILL